MQVTAIVPIATSRVLAVGTTAATMPAPRSASPKRVVIKLGTGVLTSGIGQLDTARISAVCAEVAKLRAAGTEVIIVSSGAVGLGMGALVLARAVDDPALSERILAAGCDGYIAKPLAYKEFLATVQEQLAKAASAANP